MSYNVGTNIKEPFDWLSCCPWEWIAEHTNSKRYMRLDNMYCCIVEGIDPKNMKGLENMTIEEIKQAYQDEYQIMFEEALEGILKRLKEGNLKLIVEFE